MERTLRPRPVTVALALVASALLAACAPPPPAVHSRPTGWTEVVLTRDASDAFTLEGDDDSLTLRGDPGNVAGNTRIIAWQPGRDATADHQVCVTVDGWTWPAQEGVALRVQSSEGRTRAITVTKNVWAHATSVFNVHVWDTASPELFRLLASFNLASGLAAGSGPQRLCGRTDGSTVSLKAWHTTEPEPAWGDRRATRSLELPAGWTEPGRPGVYVGHVEAGTALSVTDVSMSDGTAAPAPTTTVGPTTTVPEPTASAPTTTTEPTTTVPAPAD